MKTTQLVKIIKDAVREELKSSLPKIIKEVIKSDGVSLTPDPVDITKRILKEKTVDAQVVPKKELKRFTKNEALNRVLNETVGGVPQEGSSVGPGTSETITDFQGQEVDIDTLPEHVSTALTKDYSALLGAVDKKKKGTSG
jgi:hypothetical protein